MSLRVLSKHDYSFERENKFMKIHKVFTRSLQCLFYISLIFFVVAQEYSKPANNSIDNPNSADSCGGDLVLVIQKGSLKPACLEPSVAKKLLGVSWGNLPPQPSADILRVGQTLQTNCAEGLVLIIKNTNSKLACVTPETALQLVSRGWGIIPNS